ncbi:MAG: hypothetical protein Q8O67_06540 [Deltaproteobacteria bacterium]|nr:hypothetical protein [Deltaproteobacteria bacterium]
MHRTFFSAAALVLLSSSSSFLACSHPHARLEPLPERDAPLAEREAYYEAHRPDVVRTSTSPASTTMNGAFLLLVDGTRIDHPEDLRDQVEPKSPTAMALTRAEERRDTNTTIQIAQWSLLGGGSAIMFASIIPITLGDPANDDLSSLAGVGLVALGAGTIVMLSSLALLPWQMQVLDEANREVETAFLTYDRGLRQRLRLPPPAKVLTTTATTSDPFVTVNEVPAPLDPATP